MNYWNGRGNANSHLQMFIGVTLLQRKCIICLCATACYPCV